jgi:K+-transporting ATPase A subunit
MNRASALQYRVFLTIVTLMTKLLGGYLHRVLLEFERRVEGLPRQQIIVFRRPVVQ